MGWIARRRGMTDDFALLPAKRHAKCACTPNHGDLAQGNRLVWTRHRSDIRCLVMEVAMNPKNRLSLEVRQAILGHLRKRSDAKAISITAAKNAIHKAVPRCDLTDTELTTMIAETAIEAGFGVNFDGESA